MTTLKRSSKAFFLSSLAMLSIFSACSKGNDQEYRTAKVKRGDLRIVVRATGIVEPEEVVDVGAQVAGMINSFGTDKNGKVIDYGSQVEENTILAQIDDSLYSSDAAQASAQLERTKAELAQSQSRLVLAAREWERNQKLGPSAALSQSAFDTAKANYETAKAQVGISTANLDSAQATLNRASQNLGYTTIRSPVKGVIIDRRVNIGQTVVSSLNAPSLFLIAKDLSRMEVWASVNEADIGQISSGQAVNFTVDAFPGEEFHGTVSKIRLNATNTQNVVTYLVEIVTDNSSGRLLPYLTANVEFLVKERKDVFMVPNTALRWIPTSEAMDQSPDRAPRIWVLRSSSLEPIKVTVLGSDGTNSEIEGEGLEEGLQVIIGTVEKVEADGIKSPFIPQRQRGNRR